MDRPDGQAVSKKALKKQQKEAEKAAKKAAHKQQGEQQSHEDGVCLKSISFNVLIISNNSNAQLFN